MWLTWLLSTLYPCFSANVFPREIDMAYPTMARAKASPMTSPKTLTSGTLGELSLLCRLSTHSDELVSNKLCHVTHFYSNQY